MFIACWGGNPRGCRETYEAHQQEVQAADLLRRKQFMKKLEENPALRQEVQFEAQRRFEAHQDIAFQQMQDWELHRIYRIGSMYQEIKAHKHFWVWRKQAVLEVQQLQETQRSNREHLDAFIPAIEKVDWETADTGEKDVAITWNYPIDTTKILPITTPAAFALQQHMSSRSGTEETASSVGRPPGKRFSFCELPWIQCKAENHHWLQKGVRLGLVQGLSYDDHTPQDRLGSWTQLAKFMWKCEVATGHIVKDNKRL